MKKGRFRFPTSFCFTTPRRSRFVRLAFVLLQHARQGLASRTGKRYIGVAEFRTPSRSSPTKGRTADSHVQSEVA
jgi:hypothetical protein